MRPRRTIRRWRSEIEIPVEMKDAVIPVIRDIDVEAVRRGEIPRLVHRSILPPESARRADPHTCGVKLHKFARSGVEDKDIAEEIDCERRRPRKVRIG